MRRSRTSTRVAVAAATAIASALLVPGGAAASEAGTGQTSTSQTSPAQTTVQDTDICADQKIPKKQVVVREWWWSACGSQQPPYPPTAYTIRKPDPDGELVCQLKIPKKFVLTSDKHRSSDCYGDGGAEGWNMLFVEKAAAGMSVCVNSPIPPRWRHGESFASGQCRIGFAWTINPPPAP